MILSNPPEGASGCVSLRALKCRSLLAAAAAVDGVLVKGAPTGVRGVAAAPGG
jgi:hypothetical protein